MCWAVQCFENSGDAVYLAEARACCDMAAALGLGGESAGGGELEESQLLVRAAHELLAAHGTWGR